MTQLTDEQLNKIATGRIEMSGGSGDGKRIFLSADNNDGWEDLRIEIDTDDCDSAYAKAWAQRIIDLTMTTTTPREITDNERMDFLRDQRCQVFYDFLGNANLFSSKWKTPCITASNLNDAIDAAIRAQRGDKQ